MKKLKLALYTLLVVASLVLLAVVVTKSQSPESLMSPPEASGDYKEIQNVIEKSLGESITLKAPNGGEYTTAITFMDLNKDNQDDAVAFYRKKGDDTSAIYMSVLFKDDSHWVASKAINGKGNDILEFSYGDLNYDSIPEIVVGWNLFDSKDNNTLCVYSASYSAGKTKLSETDSLIYTKMYVADICNEGKNEILLIKNTYNDESSPATAAVYEMQDAKLKVLGKKNIEGIVTEYKQIQKQKIGKRNTFFLDGVVDKEYLITEIMYWDSQKKELVVPTDTGDMPETYRKGTVAAMDINSDGQLEIPFSTETSAQYVGITSWRQFNGTDYKEVSTGICQDGLIFNFPDAWKNKVAVSYKNSIWTFYDVSGYNAVKLFELAAVDISQWQQFSNQKFDQLSIDYGTIYGVKMSESKSALALSKNEIKNCIVNVR